MAATATGLSHSGVAPPSRLCEKIRALREKGGVRVPRDGSLAGHVQIDDPADRRDAALDETYAGITAREHRKLDQILEHRGNGRRNAKLHLEGHGRRLRPRQIAQIVLAGGERDVACGQSLRRRVHDGGFLPVF